MCNAVDNRIRGMKTQSDMLHQFLSIHEFFDSLVSQFVGDCMCKGDSVILVDAATSVRLTHTGNVSYT